MASRLNILFVTQWYPSTLRSTNQMLGIFVQEHARAVEKYANVTVLHAVKLFSATRKLYEIIDERKQRSKGSIKSICIKYRHLPLPLATYFIYSIAMMHALVILLRRDCIDLIHIHHFNGGIPAILFGKITRIPVLVSEHASCFGRKLMNKVDILEARFVLNNAEIIIPVNKSLLRAMQEYRIKNNYEIVPNTVDDEVFATRRKCTANAHVHILFVGQLFPVKGVPLLLEALCKIKEKRDDLKVDIVGDGPYKDQYVALVRKYDLNNNVTFHGLLTKSDIAVLASRAAFLISASLYEVQPCVILEALMAGLPIVAPRVGGIPEVVTEKVGILFPPGNPEKMAKAIELMLDNYKGYAREEISRYARDRYSYKVVGKKLAGIYSRFRLLGGRPRVL